jgi:ADP-heptose:LPS heptosyltransferase
MRRLLIRPGGIGDLIVSLPALESLRADFLEVWVAEQNVPLIRFADAVHSIGSTGLDLLEFAEAPKLVERLRAFDSIISWYGSNRPEFRDRIERLCLPFRFLPALPTDNKLHATDFYVAQVAVEHALACSSNLKVPSRPREDFAVIHPFASSPQKRWPVEKFREVARLLKMPVRWCAGPQEHLPDAVRIDDLYELACWLARAQIYIGNDSGISHLAAAVGTPAIVLFGPTDPAVWAPRGSLVLFPMDKIEPADVVAQADGLRCAS